MNIIKETVNIAAIGDIHCSGSSRGYLQPLFSEIQEKADILLVCGDITSYGLLEEAEIFVQALTAIIKIPVVIVLGNHDYERNKQEEIKELFVKAGLRVLNGTTCEIHGVGFAGVKGFGGGFGQLELQPWGESIVKAFVDEAVKEAIKLEGALARLQMDERIVILHYSPVEETVHGEKPEIYPFLGSSRLEEIINRHKASAVFHGHAHAGQAEGKTSTGVPVFNVAMPLLQRLSPNQQPYRLFSITHSKQPSQTT